MLPENPGCNPKANNFSNDMLWFTVQQILPISNYNSKEDVKQLEKKQQKKPNMYMRTLYPYTQRSYNMIYR